MLRRAHVVAVGVIVSLVCVAGFAANAPAASGEAQTERYFNSIQKDPNLLVAFLSEMPKGGDLHMHLSGAVYAETLIDWAAEANSCIDPATYTLSAPPCSTPAIPASTVYNNPVLYRSMIDAYSMRNWQLSGQSGHDHFFDTFGKFGSVTGAPYTGKMLADVARRASQQKEVYQELMFTPTGSRFSEAASGLRWDDKKSDQQNFADFEKALAAQMPNILKESVAQTDQAEKSYVEELGCSVSPKNPGCEIVQRYIFQVGRGRPKEIVFSQIMLGFELAKADPRFVGLNLVMPEDYYVPMHDFPVQMQMLKYLHAKYPQQHVSLHAGELVAGVVPPDGLRFHIRDSVEIAGAERIGHGVDALNETNALGLLNEMAKKKVMVEICLTSNDVILGVSGKNHPLHDFMQAGVPVALATDDEGVSRSDMTHEYLRGVEDQNLSYAELKRMARTSLEHAFVSGSSLWSDGKGFAPAKQCASIRSGAAPSMDCKKYLDASEKARLQFKLEQQFREFETQQWPAVTAGNSQAAGR